MKTSPTLLLTAIILVVCGCGSSKPSRYYTLTPIHAVTGMQSTPSSNIAICIRTLKLPDYLLRAQMIKRTGSNELQIAEFDRWAEPLEINFSRVLIEDLSSDIPTNNITLIPSTNSILSNIQVILEITEFEKNASGNATLKARWGISKGESMNFLMDKQVSYTEQLSGEGYDAIAIAMSKLTGKLSEDIAADIRTKVSAGK